MKIKSIKKVGIIGVGFMGGSLALALKRRFPRLTLSGYARSSRSYNRLVKLHIVDRAERDLREVVSNADLVILALPIYIAIDYCRKVYPFLKKGAIVFDLGSSKELMEKKCRKILPKNVDFVGCHPLCGSEKSGAQFSEVNLFKHSLCVITSPPQKKATAAIKGLWEKLGSKVVFISSRQHDKIISSLSHFPHLLSFSLTSFVPRRYLSFSPPSLKELTRIASSPRGVWRDIFLSNNKNILNDIDRFIGILKKFQRALKDSKRREILRLIKKVNAKQKVIQRCGAR